MGALSDEVTQMGVNLSAIYSALEAAGAEIPTEKNFDNLESSIRTIPKGDYGSLQFIYNNTFTTYIITKKEEYDALGAKDLNDTSNIEIGGMSIERIRVERYQFGADCNYIPRYFFANSGIDGIGPLPAVDEISDGFLANASFSQTFTIPNSVTKIGSYFLSGSQFSKTLVFGSNIKSIGDHFMYNCRYNVGTLRTNCNAWPHDQYSLATTYSSSASYTSGVKLIGTYASAWKNALPDRTQSPYRKLILD